MRRIEPALKPGRVYRTAEFGAWAKNPFALASRLVAEGTLVHLGHGLYHFPAMGILGPLPPQPTEIVRAFLGGRPFIVSGPSAWNRLGLGTTQLMAHPLIYNTERSGMFVLAGRTFMFKRARFPRKPSAEWFAVDLLNNLDDVPDADSDRILDTLSRRLEADLDRSTFTSHVDKYGSRRTKALARRHQLLSSQTTGEHHAA